MSPDYTSDHLFMLIGTNPLPNYVAAKMLARPNTHFYFVHSSNTGHIAAKLIHILELPAKRYNKIQVDEADPHSIYQIISPYAREKKGIGLNYTGGTKTMAVHAYQAIKEINTDAMFSYLDARSLKMKISNANGNSDEVSANDKVKITIHEILSLHGLSIENKFTRDPKHPELCEAIAKLYGNGNTLSTWKNWVNKNRCKDLPPAEDGLKGVIGAMEKICNEKEFNANNLANALKYEKGLSSSQIWFQGKWLEDYVLNIIVQLINQNKLGNVSDYAMNLKCFKNSDQKNNFELDLALILGYQLFAISCIVSDEKAKCKEHLFEVFVRARQVGGDEARVGLICNYKYPASLQQEVEQLWDAPGKIRVFGEEHLPDMRGYLKDWFHT
ncbi:MAG: DUF1887 family CARF protein [Desulfotomaculaceae bacterium]|nr:DUF1887 family CARF protein [Desulfotomaculaceae bacterium]